MQAAVEMTIWMTDRFFESRQDMNGFQLCEKILHFDINVRICFMSSGEINREALREIYPISLGRFIKKPITIDFLLERIRRELD
jgi:hypothetical protein